MPLFQESIVRKHLNTIDDKLIEIAYSEYKRVYSSEKIKNIKTAKEEQYQEGFIKDIFGAVLGYSVFPEQPFNIQTETKNEADSKKADGAIFQGENVIGVIELKDNKTKNLDAVKDQAFSYKNNHKDCSYVISSNFHKLRFYVDDATEYEEFDLYNLDKETFKRFYLYLRKEGLLDKNIPKLLRKETKFHEENITKSLYKDYSYFKNSFFQNVVKNNPQYDKLLLFKKSQKFLDKVLFVLFAEDKGLVTTNSIVQIVEKWQDLKNDIFDTPKPLYQLVSLFFNNLFVGKKDDKGNFIVPEFGGEIFAPDEVLDNLIVEDSVLKDDLLKLSKYDFNTDVDVNILGHIFEHSLSEIEEVEADLKGEVADKNKGKRKKDGVFYTPKYITKYIVENTVGKLCAEKKSELQLDIDIDIFEYKKSDGKINPKGIDLYERLNQYKEWLLSLKILDPACGSGAFLNQVVNFLVQEHQSIDDIIADLTNTPLRLFDTDLAILENNIYGVDINEESIEIAKLSLWLRTAKQDRKLSNLSNNIKCGNSLIDDANVAGDKAFDWHKVFPEVFAKGGFDVVIGNPPWGANFTENEKKYCKIKYPKSTEGKVDSYRIFIEKFFQLGSKSSLVSLITPNSFLYNLQSFALRELIFNNVSIYDAVELRKNIFEDAPDVVPVIISFINNPRDRYSFRARVAQHNIPCLDINTNKWEIDQVIEIDNLKKDKDLKINLRSNFNFSSINYKIGKFNTLTNYFSLRQGTKPYGKKEGKEIELLSKIKIDDSWEKAINGRNILRYFIMFENEYVQRSTDLHSALPIEIIKSEKIYFQRMRKISLFPRIVACYDSNQIHGLYTCSVITRKKESQVDLKYLLCLLNSKLINLWYKYFDTDIEIKLASVSQIPIPCVSVQEQQPFMDKAGFMLDMNKELQEISQKFKRILKRKFPLLEISKKLEEWYLLSFTDFIKELGKKKIKLSLSDEAEWESYFNAEVIKALSFKNQIEKTDKEINMLVYKLYDLTDEEIKFVEEALS